MTEVQRMPALPEGRPETGPMQFGDDWPGVFIRGDNALFFAVILENLAKLVGQTEGPTIEAHQVRSLIKLLRSCSVGNTGWPPGGGDEPSEVR